MEKLIGGRKTIINFDDFGSSYKIFFVLDMLHTFLMHLRQIVKNLMLSKSLMFSRGHNSVIKSLNVKIY